MVGKDEEANPGEEPNLHTSGGESWSTSRRRVPPDRVRRPRPHTAREPCSGCHTREARLIIKGHQATIRCARCDRFLYNAPRTETGERPRTVKTLRADIRPAQQARILNRDRGRCVLCASPDDLTIGHLLSIEDGLILGATAQELNSDANLAAMCEGCNLGLLHSAGSVTPRTYAVLIWRLVQAELKRLDGQ